MMSDATPERSRSRRYSVAEVPLDAVLGPVKVGDIVRTVVLETLGGRRAIINFRGYHLVAEAARDLHRGDILFVQVESVTDRIAVRAVPAETAEQTASGRRVARRIARQLGFADYRAVVEIVLGLLRYGLAADEATVRLALDALRRVGRRSRSAIQAVVWLLASGLPADPDSVEAVQDDLESSDSLADRLWVLHSTWQDLKRSRCDADATMAGRLLNDAVVDPRGADTASQIVRAWEILGLLRHLPMRPSFAEVGKDEGPLLYALREAAACLQSRTGGPRRRLDASRQSVERLGCRLTAYRLRNTAAALRGGAGARLTLPIVIRHHSGFRLAEASVEIAQSASGEDPGGRPWSILWRSVGSSARCRAVEVQSDGRVLSVRIFDRSAKSESALRSAFGAEGFSIDAVEVVEPDRAAEGLVRPGEGLSEQPVRVDLSV